MQHQVCLYVGMTQKVNAEAVVNLVKPDEVYIQRGHDQSTTTASLRGMFFFCRVSLAEQTAKALLHNSIRDFEDQVQAANSRENSGLLQVQAVHGAFYSVHFWSKNAHLPLQTIQAPKAPIYIPGTAQHNSTRASRNSYMCRLPISTRGAHARF